MLESETLQTPRICCCLELQQQPQTMLPVWRQENAFLIVSLPLFVEFLIKLLEGRWEKDEQAVRKVVLFTKTLQSVRALPEIHHRRLSQGAFGERPLSLEMFDNPTRGLWPNKRRQLRHARFGNALNGSQIS